MTPLHVVVHRRCELIRPVAVAIAREQVAALRRRALLLRAKAQIDEALDRRHEPHPQADGGTLRQPAARTGSGIAELVHLV